VVTEIDLELGDGRTLHAYDTGADDADGRLAVFWHHGSPNIGAPPEPLFSDAERLGIRWVSYDRPGYGGSTRRLDRDVASAAGDVSAVADTLGIDRFAVMGHSSGGSHALACAALEKHLAQSDDEPEFTPEDDAALAGEWSWFIDVVDSALAGGMGGFINDDLAGVGAWGFDPADVVAPALFLHGGRDRVVPATHGEWLARHCPSAELRLYPEDGHISVLNSGAAAAMSWLRQRAESG
jgi:pimeloyl-ACP methyl ester carboxylesterase